MFEHEVQYRARSRLLFIHGAGRKDSISNSHLRFANPKLNSKFEESPSISPILTNSMTYVCRNTSFSVGGITTSFGVRAPVNFQVVEDGVREDLVSSQNHLEGVGLQGGINF